VTSYDCFILLGCVKDNWMDMRWKIKGLVFCEQQQNLVIGQNTLRLEPMMSELLVYFCRHPNQIISKEQLLEDVWHGRYVSDNTVSKLITKLRKVLQDDARAPEFIITVPKRGYRFVAAVEAIQAIQDTSATSVSPTPSHFNQKILLLCCAVLAMVAVTWLALDNNASPTPILSAKALTSEKGGEYLPSFAADGIRLAYMNNDGENFKLYVKNMYSGEQVEVSHGSGISTGPGNWNDAGNQLVYLVATPESCEYFIREFDGLIMSEPTLIHTCRPGSYGAIKFTHDDNKLIFSESAETGQPYSLYSLDRETGKIQWLVQPDIHLGGNSQFDVHPKQNSVLISSPNEQQWEGFYQLDLDTQQLRLLFKLNSYICCGIWSHDGEHIMLMGEHPAHEIVQYALDGSNKTVIFDGALPLHRPERHSNGVDYAFTAFKYDLNVDEFNISKLQTRSLLNDTFDESLAVMAPQGNQVAYISLTSGNEELWLYDRETDKKKKVSQFADGRHYIDLAWSPDKLKVAALSLNAIHLIDLRTGKAQILPLPEKEFRGMSFKSPHQLAFSMQLGASWQVVEFDLLDNSMVRLDPRWQSVQYHTVADDWLWVDQAGQWYQGQQARPFTPPKPNLSPFYGRQFNLKKSGEYLAFYHWQEEQLEIYKLGADKPVAALKSQVGHFSIVGDTVLISQNSAKTIESDIYQTYRVNTP
jgi:DNA-binding winged helix-turn-helix (wHTH) protein/Tol biopolymer transport system component